MNTPTQPAREKPQEKMKTSMPEIPRTKLSKSMLRVVNEIEKFGFSVRSEGRGCNVYFVVRAGLSVVQPQCSMCTLSGFLNGVKASG